MPFRDFINLTHAYAWHHALQVKKVPDEPGLVSAYISKPMVRELERLVRRQLPTVKHVIANGIFTHKTPTVRPKGAPNSVEIGDLLFVRQHFSKNIPTIGRAFLLQAKRNTQPTSGNVVSGNPRIQFELYKNWPSFVGTTRIQAGCMGSRNWKFAATQTEPYGRYLAIYDGYAFNPPGPPTRWTGPPRAVLGSTFSRFPGNTTWSYGDVTAATSPSTGVACNQDFADLLEGFVLGNRGVPFTPGFFSTADHWSTFVNDMLSIAALGNYTYKSARTGVTQSQMRNSTISAFQTTLGLLIQKDEFRHFAIPRPLRWYPFGAKSREVLKDLLSLLPDGGGDIPPTNYEEGFNPPDEPGHPPILSLITMGDGCPDGLRAPVNFSAEYVAAD